MKILHSIYVFVGTVLCRFALIYWRLRDKISPPETDSVLFVAHPDDDTLFFHTFIKEYKPYVCLMTTGWSLRRMPCFFKVMKQYGVRYRAYPLDSRDKRTQLLEKHAAEVLELADFKVIATHNSTGEYGHEEHIRVHDAVCSAVQEKNRILCPVCKESIINYPLDKKAISEKQEIFKNLYVTETWVLTEQEAGTPVWVTHEKVEKLKE